LLEKSVSKWSSDDTNYLLQTCLETSGGSTEIMIKVLFQLQTACTDINQKRMSYYAITYVKQDARACGAAVRNARASPAGC
jgi:hypothetical protein